jgi:peptidoglycan/LPS O-acetylase OafA/YrhL
MPRQSTTDHIVELQSLRGIAASIVMVGHALIYYDNPSWFYAFALAFNGRSAVVVFFVLSGYVLTRSLWNARFDKVTVVRFYIQRFFRIYPAIWIASTLGLVYLFALHWQIPVVRTGALIRSQFRPDRFDTLHIVASFAGMTTFILPQLWTILVEIIASIALPGIAYISLCRPKLFPGMMAVGLLMSFSIPNSYYHVTMYLMDFVVGAALAMPGLATRLFHNVPARLVVLLILVALASTQYLPTPYWSPYVHVIETALAASVIGILIGARERVTLLKSRLLLFLGDTSYSIYLLHYVVICTVAKGLSVVQLDAHTSVNVIALSVLLSSAACAVTIALAWLSFTYVEKPGIEFGKRCYRRLSMVAPSSGAVVQTRP